MDFQENKLYTIGEVARILDISPNTLRLYEDCGLVIPLRTSANQRMYDDRDLTWLKKIRHMIKNEKMNLEGIRRLLSLFACWEIKNCSKKEFCPAYTEKKKICFEVKGVADRQNCRSCPVYRNFIFCDNLKNFLKVFQYSNSR